MSTDSVLVAETSKTVPGGSPGTPLGPSKAKGSDRSSLSLRDRAVEALRDLRVRFGLLALLSTAPVLSLTIGTAAVTHLDARLTVLLLALAALPAAFLAAFTGSLLVSTGLKPLRRAISLADTGNPGARIGPPYPRDDFGELAKAFDSLATNVAGQVAALQDRVDLLGGLLRDIPCVTYVYKAGQDDSLSLVYVSPQIENLLSFSPDEWTADPELWVRQIHPADRDWVVKAYAESCLSCEPFSAEYRICRRDGRTIWVRDEARFTPGPEGQAVLMQGMMFDITGRKLAEDAVRDSEMSYRTMFAANQLPMWVYDRETLQFLEVNEAAVDRYGYSRQEFLNMLVSDILAKSEVERHLDEAYLRAGPLASPDMRHRLRGGQEIDVHISVHELTFAGRDAVMAVSQDITERKHAERELRESEKRFRAIFEGAPIGVALTDLDGRIVKGNRTLQVMLGLGNDELRVKTLASLFHTEDVPGNQELFHELVSQLREKYELECRVLRKDGSQVLANVTVSLLRSGKSKPEFVIAMLEDITERKRAQEQSKQQLERLAGLRSIDMAINASLDLRVTLSVILDQLTSQLRVDAADVLLLNQHNQTLEYAAGRGFHFDGITRTRLRMGEGLAGRAAVLRRTYGENNVTQVADAVRAQLLSGEEFVAYYVVPLIAKGQVKGVLEVFHRDRLDAGQEWLDFLEALASQAAIAIDNATMFNDLQHTNIELALAYDTTLEGWSRALDLRDKETEGHTQRVTEMTMRLARSIGMSEAELVQVHRGALLHDIGKMGIPDSILLKPGPLTDEEWRVMRMHPVYAYELLSPIHFLRPALDIPYCHHEKWDGSGYPRGLKNDQIPLAARVFAIVDVWDALRSDRPYRKAWSEDKVRDHLRSLSGSHFDPRVVHAFMSLTPYSYNTEQQSPFDSYVDAVRPVMSAARPHSFE